MDRNGTRSTRLELPDAPATEDGRGVKVWEQPVEMLTWLPEPPDPNPMFLEKRVYQGSSGRVYPLPFIDRIATEPQMHTWRAVHLENDLVRLMILPEIGGRIHVGLDKTNGYDFFYRQNVIKPALVGLAGPWISGGVEFNWPQHHRPATFLPVSVELERHPDGSVTVWCSDYDRMSGMKGMHGVCLHPHKALVELKVRLYNATAVTQSFLWWANAAVRVHQHYQSFFPTDAHYVADHAKRAISTFPLCDGVYYGVDYRERARAGVPAEEQPRCFVPGGSYAPNDLSWYANIPVPTSYMVVGSQQDFFGGYDHAAQAGVVHVANHHIAPGKKQWTWGNHEFGYAWDGCLSESDGPYIELMAGVFTDNQPDFSFLAPGETRSFQQYWYPIRGIGTPQMATVQAALHCEIADSVIHLSLCVTGNVHDASILIQSNDAILFNWTGTLSPSEPWLRSVSAPAAQAAHSIVITVHAGDREILRYCPARPADTPTPPTASEPLAPEQIGTLEELYLTGLHLEQYRHATRLPEPYWREALRRDPGDSRSNNALGRWHLRRGESALAQQCFERAIDRLTQSNPNPPDGEPFYNLGLALQSQCEYTRAHAAFYKAAWNAAWQSPAFYALAALSAREQAWDTVLEHLDRVLRVNADHLQAHNLRVAALRSLGRVREAAAALDRVRALDPLDLWSRYTALQELPATGQLSLHLACELITAGLTRDAAHLLALVDPAPRDGAAPMLAYLRAWCHTQGGNAGQAAQALEQAAAASPAFCFPHRLQELQALEAALAANPSDARAHYYLGNLLYDKRRHREAIVHWECAAGLDPAFPTVWRNLGIALYNIQGDRERALSAFDRAHHADPRDARILFERDQLWKRVGIAPATRLAELERHAGMLSTRDDLSVELAGLYNLTGQPQQALALIRERRFQPWEGGEGLALAQYVRALLMLGRQALASGDQAAAQAHFLAAFDSPANLGEARHLLVNQAELCYWAGVSFAAADRPRAIAFWQRAALSRGDFQDMSIRAISEASYWSALSLQRLERHDEANALLAAIEHHAHWLAAQIPEIDYFATSLATMLLFDEDLRERNQLAALFLHAQAAAGRGDTQQATLLLEQLLAQDSNHAGAAELLAQLHAPAAAGA